MRHFLAALLAATALTSPALAQDRNGWGVDYTDVTPDPDIRFGTLPNGMKYAIRKNEFREDAAAVRLQFEFGSVAEAEDEQGLAHFIEHMAFNGTTNVPELEMIKILERLGLKFGPDTNASTSSTETQYKLDLPSVDDEHVDTALFLLRETASEVRFDPDAVDRERGVILGEKRARDGWQYDQLVDQWMFLVPDTPYPHRLPIGTAEVLENAPAERLRDLYRRYYRPENATLVFVGDTDPDAIEAKIIEVFGDWRGVGDPGAPLPKGTIDLTRPSDVDTFIHPAAPTQVQFVIYRPHEDADDTLADRRKTTVRNLAIAMFNQRVRKRINQPGSSLLAGGMGTSSTDDVAEATSFGLTAKEGAWQTAIAVIEQDIRRVMQFGFQGRELDVAVETQRGALKRAVDRKETRSHQALANAILSTIGDDEFVTTPEFKLQFFEQVVKDVTLAEIDEAFRELWTGSEPLIHIANRVEVDEAQVAAALSDSAKIAVEALEEEEALVFAYDDFGDPGEVVEDSRIEDLDIRTLRFANNVRLNIKQTDFEKGRLSLSIRLGGGNTSLPQDRVGLASFINSTAALGGTGAHSLEDLRQILAGRSIQLGYGVSTETTSTGATITPEDLELQLKVSAAFMSDPGYRQEAQDRWANTVPLIDKQVRSTPGSVAGSFLPEKLTGDARLAFPGSEALLSFTLEEARAAMAPIIAQAPIEIAIVGDIAEDDAIAMVARSFGALPERRLEPIEADPTPIRFLADTAPIELEHEGPIDQTMVAAIWPTIGSDDFQLSIALTLLKEVIQLQLTDKLREELGATYGAGVSSFQSPTYPDYGYMRVTSIVAPDRADEVDAAIREVIAQLRATPVDADIMERARTPMLEATEQAKKNNGFWLGYVDEAQTEPGDLDRLRQREAAIRAVTPEWLQQLAGHYLTEEAYRRVRISSNRQLEVVIDQNAD
ncbi:M16 family metallopeptidase [Sphingomicrobium flavum]|uniref:M16 family metallopeptidase n=1 Tax=Sphingomicrobium flavum TaxID=1229164 RepID=UPI0021AE2993|nr:insulinase family protein [Sphingomicrobium flavum]